MNQDIKTAISYINNHNDGFISNKDIDLDAEFRAGADPTGSEALGIFENDNSIENLDDTSSTNSNISIAEDDNSQVNVDDLF